MFQGLGTFFQEPVVRLRQKVKKSLTERGGFVIAAGRYFPCLPLIISLI